MDIGNTRAVTSEGLLVGLMEELGTNIIIRGLRSNADLELEQQLAAVNAGLLKGAETVILLSKPEMVYVNSGIVKELISYGADVSGYVPEDILEIINRRKTQ
jgi:pantetheine-phosphate adenylyltransferase